MAPEQFAGQRELFRAMAVRQQSIVTNPMEAVRQNVKEEAANEFTRLEGHDFPGAAGILAAEADVAAVILRFRGRASREAALEATGNWTYGDSAPLKALGSKWAKTKDENWRPFAGSPI